MLVGENIVNKIDHNIKVQNCSGDQIENEMGGECSTYGGEERRVQGLGGET